MTDEDLMDSDDIDTVIDSDDSLPISDGVMSKEAERRRLQAEVEAFLARGGKIDEIPPNVVADPPKKPESNYGGQPI
ncbi:hypothetical protein P886_0559 [Alteromonadaceae bacterium 2753L.S.0a.02]|nr:hypothetical protein P886_0559 [Alteromonadaceae bacterium 2753L.S.0a.02]